MTKDHNDADVAFVQALAEVLRKNDLAELEVERGTKTEGKLSVRLSRATLTRQVAVAPQPVSAASAPAPAQASVPVSTDSDDPADLPGAVTSPMVGTVYLQPEPGQDAFVKLGDKVTEGQTLLIVEAMKTMNHIPAPKAGTVRRILVEDRAPVEYGAPLMIVD